MALRPYSCSPESLKVTLSLPIHREAELKVAYATMMYRYLSPLEALRKLHDMGIEEFEVSYDNFVATRRGREDELLDELASQVKKTNYRILSVHLPYDRQTLEQLIQMKEGAITRMIRWLRAAHDMGASIAVIHTAPAKSGYEDSLQVNVKAMERLSREARALGLTLAVENRLESDMFGSSLEELTRLVESVEGLAMCVDVGHLNANGRQPQDELPKVIKYIAEVHVHDNDGESDLHLPPMTGTIDWYRVAGALVGYQGQLTYEVSCQGPQARCDNYVRLVRMFHRHVLS